MNIIYFSNVWPQSQVSAASHRVFGFIYSLFKNECKISFISASNKSKKSSEIKQIIGINSLFADPNDMKSTTQILQKLKFKPDIAIFDTFSVEEKYSHYIYKLFPQCMRILDLQDFHSLRLARQDTLKNKPTNILTDLEVLSTKPIIQDNSNMLARELASMYRSDLIITCSDYEQFLLKHHYNISSTALITFFQTELDEPQNKNRVKTYDNRRNFVWIGNFNHPPNVDALNWLLSEAWPEIRKKTDEKAELHIYGANFRKEFSGLEKQGNGVRSMGLMKDLNSLAYYRVLLAPLRFGAGIKGKICDGWYYGLPCVTTPIGSEGMYLNTFNNNFEYQNIDLNNRFFKKDDSMNKTYEENPFMTEFYQYKTQENSIEKELSFGGLFNNWNTENFVNSSVDLYLKKDLWEHHAQMGYKILETRMGFLINEALIMSIFTENLSKLKKNRNKNHIQALTWSETLRSTETLAKYISLKELQKKQELK